MDDYRLAVLLSVFVLIPLSGWKVIGMVKKLQTMSSRQKKLSKGLTPKQKEFVKFLERASNQSQEKNDA
tara:strand:- start:750 stop:956 length:207 start_codon:yes stop_codon:yes gene_type:complete